MRLLLIEDYEPLRKSLVKGLKEAGFAVDFTGDGEEGLWYVMSSEYDVIVLDLMLPKIDGLSILKKIRHEGKHVNILILTAKDALEDKVKGLNLGADDYLIKPFAFEELLARLRALVRRNYQKTSNIITVANIRIELNTKQVYRNNELILLTPREYALLEYLAFRTEEVVTRTDIWEHVYEFNSSASSNVVDVYIGYLRKKIDKDTDTPLIHTVRGHGYFLGIKQ